MDKLTFRKTVNKEEALDIKFQQDTKEFYDLIIDSIDEIAESTFLKITQEPFGEFVTFKIIYAVKERS
ncbi:hypothetical protein HP439_13335 [Sphingobacterium shayense]|uniref:hypothetical protein n=1 Tax=Sphingobacterium shayense TaxID=626343 RepID=UPI0015577E87|nr:hypothetical protein [Sphingobacterium shayense]NQD71707.1 hypothetical protein [Sphingobacterium shayense]